MNKQKLIIDTKMVKVLNDWKQTINSGPYKPYLTVRQVRQMGRRNWHYCPIQKRSVHLLSDGERRAYDILLSCNAHRKVMEQFALDIDTTLSIAEEMNVQHPRDYRNNKAYVMTTDFVVTSVLSESPEFPTVAYTFKYYEQLYDTSGQVKKESRRAWEKLSIEQRYWNQLGIEYRVITEQDASKERAWNIGFCASSTDAKFDKNSAAIFASCFAEHYENGFQQSLRQLCCNVANDLKISLEESISAFKYCVLFDHLVLVNDFCLREFRPVNLDVAKG
jgi:hypothetical protein